jgi:hypothetical protein
MPSPIYSQYLKPVFIFSILLIAVYPEVYSEDIDQLSELTVPLSVYILDDRDGIYSSERSKEEIVSIFQKVNEIWSQAAIKINVRYIHRTELPHEIIKDFIEGNYKPFLNGINRKFNLQNHSIINAFYSKRIGGPNGRALTRYGFFLVTDTSFVHDQRVTSHEIGHLLGLGHEPYNRKRLMYSGTNGIQLTTKEINTARKNAAAILKSSK